jgi:glycosyltransferase involved in cell wall biosynthesis
MKREEDIYLSICVPTYNRADLLERLINSIPVEQVGVELVIVDDGSTDHTGRMVMEYKKCVGYPIVYQWHENYGRAKSLHDSIILASGMYTIIMDSDDWFVDGGVSIILSFLKEYMPATNIGKRMVEAVVFGARLISGIEKCDNYPPITERTNFIAIKADYGVDKDLKEVVCTDIIKKCLYSIDQGCRRVPTYLIWAKVAEDYDCLCVRKIVACKEYLPGGMTDRILLHKTRDARPMVELYASVSGSTMYNSRYYRWKCRLLWGRYAFHAGILDVSNLWQVLILPFAWMIYIYDRYQLRQFKS